jgi:hypothetical protein
MTSIIESNRLNQELTNSKVLILLLEKPEAQEGEDKTQTLATFLFDRDQVTTEQVMEYFNEYLAYSESNEIDGREIVTFEEFLALRGIHSEPMMQDAIVFG